MISFKKHFGLHICCLLLVKTNASVTCLFPAHVSWCRLEPRWFRIDSAEFGFRPWAGPKWAPHVCHYPSISSFLSCGRKARMVGGSTCSCSLKLHQPKQVLWSTPNSRGSKNISHTPRGQNERHSQPTISMAESFSKGKGGNEHLLNL